MLVLPRLDVTPSRSAWIDLVDLSLAALPALDASHLPLDSIVAHGSASNNQTRESFAAEAKAIADRQVRLTWLAPSRNENATGETLQHEEANIWTSSDDSSSAELEAPAPVQGGRERGLILHKLMEETGETVESLSALAIRAEELIRALGRIPAGDPAAGLAPEEPAGCVARTLALPQIAELTHGLLAEFPVYAIRGEDTDLLATAGIADALTVSDGRPAVIVDWKSDGNPDHQSIEHYRSQVRTYLDVTGAERGLIVLMTSGTVITVMPSPQMMAA